MQHIPIQDILYALDIAFPNHGRVLRSPSLIADHLSGNISQANSHESTSDGNSEHNSSCEEDSQLRRRLKRKLQRNRTSFSNEQIDSLEKGFVHIIFCNFNQIRQIFNGVLKLIKFISF